MKLRQRTHGEVTILDLNGRLILGDGEQLFRDTVDDLIQRGRTKVLLNLTGVTYIDSAGIGTMMWKYSTLLGRGGALKLLNPQSRTETVLAVTRLLTILETFHDEAAAIASFSQPPDPVDAAGRA